MNSRDVRVFVSSTFQDMHGERDVLVKRVFPRLRAICEERGVVCTEIDLRWGIEDEQRELALSLCLAAIRDCQPFFIGILGERYGWVPDSFSPEALKEHAWLSAYQGRSITELEILEGALNNPELAEQAFFYFRDPAAAVGHGHLPADCSSRTAQARMMDDLKTRIRRSGLPVRENYRSAQHLGELVYQDLLQRIDRLYPAASVANELDRQAAMHDRFAQRRRSVYIGQAEYVERLDAHVAGDGMPLVVTGESGCGKSAVLANWLALRAANHAGERRCAHFVGAASDSAYWPEILRRFGGELWRQFAEPMEIPSGVAAEAERAAFMFRLERFASQGPFILVIDGLDHLEERQRGLDLDWLPASVPVNCRLIVSTASHRQRAKLCARGWPVLAIEPLNVSQRVAIVNQSLSIYGKSLGVDRTRRIVGADQSANPLYLRTLVEELRLFGHHAELDRQLSHYLAATGPVELFVKAIDRIEQDFTNERKDLVCDAFSLLWAARAGLTEPELLDLLGDGEPLPAALWMQLRLAFGNLLADRSGVVAIDATLLRAAIKQRYVLDTQREDTLRWRLVEYFQHRPNGPRKYGELPWQLYNLGAWDRLAGTLADPSFLESAWSFDAGHVRRLWMQIEALSPITRLETYAHASNWLPEHHQAIHIVIDLLRQWEGAAREPLDAAERLAGSLALTLVEHFRATGEAEEFAKALRLSIELMLDHGQCEQAVSALAELKDAYARANNRIGFVAQYHGIVEHTAIRGTPIASKFYAVFTAATLEAGNLYFLDNIFAEHSALLRSLGSQANPWELIEAAEQTSAGGEARVLVGCLRAILHYRAGQIEAGDAALDQVREALEGAEAAEYLEFVMRSRNTPRQERSPSKDLAQDASLVRWTSADRSTSLVSATCVSPIDADEMRQRICALEDAGDHAGAWKACEQLTAAIRSEGHPRRLRNHLLMAGRLLKKLGREDDARRIGREIVQLTSENDASNLDVFCGLVAELGLAAKEPASRA